MMVTTDIPRPAGVGSDAAGRLARWRSRAGRPRAGVRLGVSSPRLSRAELAVACGAGLALAIATSWPLAAHLGSRIAPDLGDPIRTAWQVAWLGHVLVTAPLHLWSSNAFYPAQHTLAFSDSLLGYGPAGLIGHGPVAAIVRYNLLFLFAYAFAFVGAYLLARELGIGAPAAAVAGAAFAYAPFRAAEAGHLHVISSGGIALSLFLLLRGYRRASVATVLAGWLVAAWQLSLGFTLGLQFAYLLGLLTIVAAIVWLRRGRPPLPRRLVVVTCVGIALLGGIAAFEARPYLQVSHRYPTARRAITEVQRYSAPARALLAAPFNNRVWGDATAPIRDRLSSKNESDLFPGALILVLALTGAWAPVLPRALRLGLLALAVGAALLALGLSLTSGGYPYRLLYDHLPGWNGVRTPGRLITTASLALALLTGAGAHWLIGRLPAASRAAPALGIALALAVVVEGSARMATPVVPPLPAGSTHLRGPLLELPTDPANDRLYQLWSTADWATIANGNSTFDIPAQDDLRGAMQDFPDRPGIRKLRRLGIQTVVLHTRLPTLPPLRYAIPEPPDPRAAARRPIAGLGITRRRVGSLYIYEIGR